LTTESAWANDKRRYPKRPFHKELSIWALAVYRFGRWNDARPTSLSRRILDRLYWLLFRVSEALTGISIGKAVEIGPGFRIWHFGNIFIHDRVKIGANVTIRHGVTIGVIADDGPVPVVEDDVEFGAYAQVLGGVRIGRGAKIGPMSVVLIDVPAGSSVFGNPARIVFSAPRRQSRSIGPASSATVTPRIGVGADDPSRMRDSTI
jgi:serine O-acetyltransferase